MAQIHHDVDQILGQPLAPQKACGRPLKDRPKRLVGPKAVVLAVKRPLHEQPLRQTAQREKRHDGEGERHAVASQALDEHLGQGLGRKEGQHQEGRADGNAKPCDEQQRQRRQNVPSTDGREGHAVFEDAVKLAKRQVVAFAAEVLAVPEVTQRHHHRHDGACKQPELPPLATLVGHQKSAQGLDAVVADHRVGGQRKSQKRECLFQGVGVAGDAYAGARWLKYGNLTTIRGDDFTRKPTNCIPSPPHGPSAPEA